MMCGSCSNENAFKLMHFAHMEREREGRPFTQEEIDTCMINQVRLFFDYTLKGKRKNCTLGC